MPVTLPKGMSEDQAEAWFGTRTPGRFNPTGAVSQLWAGLGRFPALMAIDREGEAEYFRFADGTVMLRASAGAAPKRVEAAPGGGALPARVSEALAETWFGTETESSFNPNGAVSRLWLELGRFPTLAAIDREGDAEYFRFADGTVVLRANAGAAPEIVGAGPGGGELPAGVNAALAEIWFGTETEGRFNPERPVSQLWLSLGRFPTLVAIEKSGDATYYRFADGTVILRPDSDTAPDFFPPRKRGAMPSESIWGNIPYTLNQEHGVTEFSQTPLGQSFYEYTLVYCRTWCEPLADPPDGCLAGHPGLDIGIGFDTALFTPVDGEVICAGTGNGSEGCAAFRCVPASGNAKSGRFELKLANGDRLIYGHMADITVEPGDILKAGDPVGFSGRDNGDHVHIEYRQAFPECQAGCPFLLVDPQDKFGKLT